MGTSNYVALTRSDLAGFNPDATDMILRAVELGAVGRISNKGHAILRAPNGQTVSVSKLTGRGSALRNVQANWRRVFGPLEVQAARAAVAATEGQAGTTTQPDLPEPATASEEPRLACPVEKCPATFVTEGARYSHVHDKHYPCKHPGCEFVSDWAPASANHYRLTHTDWRHEEEKPAEPAVDLTESQAVARLEAIRKILGGDEELERLKVQVKDLRAELAQKQVVIDRLTTKLAELRQVLG